MSEVSGTNQSISTRSARHAATDAAHAEHALHDNHSHIHDSMHPMPGMQASPILTSAHKIAIAGLGLIGGSLALRLAERGRYVIAWNHNSRPYEAAARHHIRCVDSLEALAAGKPDVLVLATPLTAMPAVLAKLAPALSPATTLTDVGSVKTELRQQVSNAGLAEYYVGAHPMAGNERSGFAAADPTLFDGALWAITVDENTRYDRYLTVADMITQGVGNRIITLDDHIHDSSAAMISHMPHVVSTALSAMLVDSEHRNIEAALAAGSWRDMTRVSLTDPDRTRAMIEEDSGNVASLLRQLSQRLSSVAESLEQLGDVSSQTPLEKEQSPDAQQAEKRIYEFFQAPEPFRAYKRKQRKDNTADENSSTQQLDGQHNEITIPEQAWQQTLIESAKAGEQITGFVTTHAARVITRSL
ncbi:prephenate dehydrogenase [Bifidobacterium aquikefiri]|uniref:Prephenate dehydrogenase n=2 Tax=Bifidobacterium aquikefiri TaxID=1653207 RepID=A0A261G0Z7_9BIFI|nr:prephenate dehydrogenase [Bifidobacterium aquikefiri]